MPDPTIFSTTDFTNTIAERIKERGQRWRWTDRKEDNYVAFIMKMVPTREYLNEDKETLTPVPLL